VNDTSAILATGMPCADNWARRQVTTDPVPPADDPQQPPTLVVIDLTNLYTSSHVIILARPAAQKTTHTANCHEANVVSARTSSASY
jgi:hypothetical protein